jgi:hypothetical protein
MLLDSRLRAYERSRCSLCRGNERSRCPFVPAKAGTQTLRSELVGKIAPAGIHPLDQSEPPCATPFFDAVLVHKSAFAALVGSESNELLDAILFRESRHCSDLVLPYAASEIIDHSDIQRTVPTACQNVYEETHSSVRRVRGCAGANSRLHIPRSLSCKPESGSNRHPARTFWVPLARGRADDSTKQGRADDRIIATNERITAS